MWRTQGHCHVNRKFAGQMTMAATVNAATVAWRLIAKHAQGSAGGQRWSRLSEQIFRIDKWSVCRG